MAAVFVVPTFNITCRIWRSGNSLKAPPDVVTLGNLSPGKIVANNQSEGLTPAQAECVMWLRVPIGTDIRDSKYRTAANLALPDTVEAPALSGRYYTVAWVDDVGFGFPNEHRFATLYGNRWTHLPFPAGNTPPLPDNNPPLVFFSRFATAPGVPVNGMTISITPIANGNRVWMWLQYFGVGDNPTWNTHLFNLATQNFVTGGMTTGNLCMWYLPRGAGVANWMLQFAMGNLHEFHGMIFYEPITTGNLGVIGNPTGLGTQPNMTPAANPLGGAPQYQVAGFHTITEPAGELASVPWFQQSTDVDSYVIGGNTWRLRVIQLPSPDSPYQDPLILAPPSWTQGWGVFGAAAR